MSEVGTEMDEDDEEEGGFLSSYSSLLLPSAGDEALLLGCRNSEAEGLVAAPPKDPNAPKSSSSSSSRSSGVGKLRMPRPQGFDLWFCSIVDVPCTQSAEWNIFLSFVTDDERMKITRFRFDDDRKRALVSILLQKAFIRHRLGLGLYADADGSSSSGSGAYDGDEDVFSIRRTPEGKPYAFLKGQPGAPTLDGHWNYNLSHHGQFVAIVSHPKYLIGIDLVDISTRSPSIRSAQAYVEMFDRNLEQKELAFILGQANEDARYNAFFVIWSLKESFIKAIGMGLGFELENISFAVSFDEGRDGVGTEAASIRGTATASIYKVPRKDWRFHFSSLDARHIMAVALGPIDDAIDSYRHAAWPAAAATKTRFVPMEEGALELPPALSRSVTSLLRGHELELYRRACFLPTHCKEVCACCTPVPFDPKLGDGAFNGQAGEPGDDDFAGTGGANEDDVLVTGTPLPRSPMSPYSRATTPAFLRPPILSGTDSYPPLPPSTSSHALAPSSAKCCRCC